MPRWIQEHIHESQVNLSIEEAIMSARRWFPLMAQPFTREHQLGVSLLSAKMLNEANNIDVMDKFRNVVTEID